MKMIRIAARLEMDSISLFFLFASYGALLRNVSIHRHKSHKKKNKRITNTEKVKKEQKLFIIILDSTILNEGLNHFSSM